METLRKRLLNLMNQADYLPMNKSELSRSLRLHSSERAEMRSALVNMLRDGEIVRGKKSRYSTRASKKGRLVGTLRSRGGNGWFYPDPEDQQNEETVLNLDEVRRIFVGRREQGVALDGDRVQLEIGRIGAPKWHKHVKGKASSNEVEVAGRVVQILERRHTHVIGTYMKHGKFRYVQPDDSNLPPSIKILEVADARPGQKVSVQLTQWERQDDVPEGNIVAVIGWPEDPGVDIVSVIHRHGIRQEFSNAVQKEAEKTPEVISEEEMKRREDWRDRLVITVDPFDAKDHDDAVWVARDGKHWDLAVHIADVSHYVKPGTSLDTEAQLRGNSTYLVDRVLPMLPTQLSNNICSLRPDVDRLTKCAVIRFDATGKITKTRFCDAVICSGAKLSYEEAQEMIEGKGEGTLADQVRDSWELASLLRRRRFNQGALDLDFPETKVLLDEEKVPVDVVLSVHNQSHQMIEEFMLIANEVVAIELKRKRRNAIHRIHEEPDIDRLNEFADDARQHGYQVGDLTNAQHVRELLNACRGELNEAAIKLGLLKSMKRAAYSVEGLGHYGLAKMDYCHFTSPIRRYADLIVHRAMQSLLSNPPAQPDRVVGIAELEATAKHISETERTSASAESESKRMKIMEFLVLDSKKPDPTVFEAMITEVRRSNLFVEVMKIQSKGMVKKEDFPSGEWVHEPHLAQFHHSKLGDLRLGQRIEVQVTHVDMERMLVDYKIVNPEHLTKHPRTAEDAKRAKELRESDSVRNSRRGASRQSEAGGANRRGTGEGGRRRGGVKAKRSEGQSSKGRNQNEKKKPAGKSKVTKKKSYKRRRK